jgi:hypothetical protein
LKPEPFLSFPREGVSEEPKFEPDCLEISGSFNQLGENQTFFQD